MKRIAAMTRDQRGSRMARDILHMFVYIDLVQPRCHAARSLISKNVRLPNRQVLKKENTYGCKEICRKETIDEVQQW